MSERSNLMAEHPVFLDDDELLKNCDVQRTKRGGPGGQHRNKVESAIVITHLKSGIRGEASERRSQHENKAVAIARFRKNLAVFFRLNIPWEEFGEPTELWQSRCKKGRISLSAQHLEFPMVLAEVFERLNACEYDLKKVAVALTCTSSQLIKLIKKEPGAFAKLNLERTKRELSTFK